MAIKKKTVDEVLETYLDEKGLDEENIKRIKKNLHKSVQKELGGEETEISSTKMSHGTSCPRISDKYGNLLTEF